MSIYGRLRRAYRALTREQFEELGLLGPPVASGVAVTQQSANTVAAYWNGVCVISADLGVIDRHVYRRIGDDDREKATTAPAYKLIHDQPNPQTTAMQFWETIVSHAVSWGNGYAEIEYDNASRPVALWNLPPDQVEAKVETITDRRGRKLARKFYVYQGQIRLEYEDVLHVPGLGFDGVRGYSPVFLARQSLGLSMAAERFGGAFFGNGAWPGIALEHPAELGPEALERLRKSVNGLHQGPDRAHKLLILEEGMKVSKPISIPPDEAQFLETRSFQIEEIARWLNLPPHKLKHKVNERPGGNFEASELDYQVTTLLPWATRIEQECDRKLLPASQRGSYYTEHNFKKRLVTDTATRVQAQKAYLDMGVLTPEQIARQENLPKPQGEPQSDPAPAPPARQAPARGGDVRAAQQALLLAELGRFMRREAENVRRAARKADPTAFGEWLEEFYGQGEEAVLRDSLIPAVRLCMVAEGCDGDAGGVAAAFAQAYLANSKAALLDVRARDLEKAVGGLLKRWETTRAAEALSELSGAMMSKEGLYA